MWVYRCTAGIDRRRRQPPSLIHHTPPKQGDGFPSGEGYGGVWILFLNKEGTVKKWRRLDELDQVILFLVL